MGNDTPATLEALHVDETKLRGHVDEVVRSSVEETAWRESHQLQWKRTCATSHSCAR